MPVYTYDTENLIKNIDNGVVDFAYDSEGRQIRRTFLGTSTYYLYGLTGLISEFTATNTGASQASSTDRLRYRLSEQTGTAVLFVLPSGSLVESNRVYPYGEKWMADYGTSNDQKFTTYTRQNDHYTDEVDYAMARYYFYSHGAFMSPDPLLGQAIDPQTWNRYSYGLDDPINFVDPSGLCWTIDNLELTKKLTRSWAWTAATSLTWNAGRRMSACRRWKSLRRVSDSRFRKF